MEKIKTRWVVENWDPQVNSKKQKKEKNETGGTRLKRFGSWFTNACVCTYVCMYNSRAIRRGEVVCWRSFCYYYWHWCWCSDGGADHQHHNLPSWWLRAASQAGKKKTRNSTTKLQEAKNIYKKYEDDAIIAKVTARHNNNMLQRLWGMAGRLTADWLTEWQLKKKNPAQTHRRENKHAQMKTTDQTTNPTQLLPSQGKPKLNPTQPKSYSLKDSRKRSRSCPLRRKHTQRATRRTNVFQPCTDSAWSGATNKKKMKRWQEDWMISSHNCGCITG